MEATQLTRNAFATYNFQSLREKVPKIMHWNSNPKITTSVTRFCHLDLSCDICVLSKCSQVVLCNAILGQSIAFLFRLEALLRFCGISDYLQLCTRYADSIVKLYAVCAVHGLRFQFVFVEIIQIYFIGLVESGLQGHGSDNSVVCYFLQLRSAFSCHGWLLGDIPLHVFVLHTIWSASVYRQRVPEFSGSRHLQVDQVRVKVWRVNFNRLRLMHWCIHSSHSPCWWSIRSWKWWGADGSDLWRRDLCGLFMWKEIEGIGTNRYKPV